ncbi:MAG: hypothetical protein ACRDSZ_05460 [Pseudonocardiaceae bacterium]
MSKYSEARGLRWCGAPGSLRAWLLRLDGQLGAVVNAEKHVVEPAVVSSRVAGELGRLVQEMRLGSGDGQAVQPGGVPGFESVTPGFTRVAGLLRQQVSDR